MFNYMNLILSTVISHFLKFCLAFQNLLYDILTQFLLLLKLVVTFLQRKPIISVHPPRPVFNYHLFISADLMTNIADGVFISLLSVCLSVCQDVTACGLITLFQVQVWHLILLCLFSVSICTQRHKHQQCLRFHKLSNHGENMKKTWTKRVNSWLLGICICIFMHLFNNTMLSFKYTFECKHYFMG